ncbi:MAG: hypothetical protein AAF602_17335 [Myxococcota bacterium]
MNRSTITWVLAGLAALGVALVTPAESTLVGVIETVGTEVAETPPAPRFIAEAPGPEVAPPQWLFAPDLPAAPHRMPLRSLNVRPPIGGRVMVEAVSAARSGRCAEALETLQYGMHEVSPDYAGLVRPVWRCFDETHGRPLSEARVTSQLGMQAVHEHLSGERWWHDRRERTPYWYRAAQGGLELRLERLTADPLLQEALLLEFHAPTLADQLARDVHLEALAAVSMSRMAPAERTVESVDLWARRVFVAQWALRELPGELLGQYRPEVFAAVEALLDEATSLRQVDGEVWPVPAVVRQARAVARGERRPPA